MGLHHDMCRAVSDILSELPRILTGKAPPHEGMQVVGKPFSTRKMRAAALLDCRLFLDLGVVAGKSEGPDLHRPGLLRGRSSLGHVPGLPLWPGLLGS